MEYTFLQFEQSAWLILFCLLIAALGTYLLYPRGANWPRNIRYILVAVRFTCLFILSILLLDPILNQIDNTIEKPTWIIGVDNSTSITEVLDSVAVLGILDQVNNLKTDFESKDYLVNFRTLSDQTNQNAANVSFDGQVTNIDKFLKSVQNDYEGRNLAGIVLISDGIYNRGISPLYDNYGFPIHTIGIGDTIPKSDLYLQNLKYNKISYQGNDFPIVAIIGNKGGEKIAEVTLSHKGKTLESKEITLPADQLAIPVIFQTEAVESGIQKFKMEISTKEYENNTSNNIRYAYVDIVDGKERILLIAVAPHPDIKAISTSINTRKNYELITYIPDIHKEKPKGKFDLVIYHQLPSRSQAFGQIMKQYPPKDVPYLFLPGLRSDIQNLANTLEYVSIRKLSSENDQVTAAFNRDFAYFNLSQELQNAFPQFPPLEVPFSEITASASSSSLLYQRVGNVATKNPLLLINGASEVRSGLLLGEGLWRWKLHEYHQNGNNDGFDELLLKLVQYLSTKIDKRKFKCTPVRSEITANEPLVFETEVYNELYELIYGQNIDLELTEESGDTKTYSFTNIEESNGYKINNLSSGVYKYKATTKVNSVSHTVSGELVLKDQQIESLNTTANHYLLQRLAKKNNGTFHSGDNFPPMEKISSERIPGVIHSAESITPLINFKWLFFFFLALLATEWFTRKYNGTY